MLYKASQMQPQSYNQARINHGAHKGTMFALSRQSSKTFPKQRRKPDINVTKNARK